MQWISYSDSEVNAFHPICKRCLESALSELGVNDEYEVLHHQYTGALEMDIAVRNMTTGKYLCVVEVKRTPADVNSARYQHQAMSYVQENIAQTEKPFYVLTNLECAYVFKYDERRPRVSQQILKPGLQTVGRFCDFEQQEFEAGLTDFYRGMLAKILNNEYEYSLSLAAFEEYISSVRERDRIWKSSLAILLYEYIRGAFLSVGRRDLPHDVSTFNRNVRNICSEAIRVNFRDIFDYDDSAYEQTIGGMPNGLLADMLNLGKTNISGDSVADILHGIVSRGSEHLGEVPTDLELARAVAVLARKVSGEIGDDQLLCDPASGSGNLISSAADVFGIRPNQIKANDINMRLLELLSLRFGLKYPATVSPDNTAHISALDVAELQSEHFSDVKVVVMNPPFVAGINCIPRKQQIFRRIRELTNSPAITDAGQMNLEGAFLELVCDLCSDGTVIACILPVTHLVARGQEAAAIRRILLEKLGLRIVFQYPMDGLFENVVKQTCVLVGVKGSSAESISILSSTVRISDIDLDGLSRIDLGELVLDEFRGCMPGVDGAKKLTRNLASTIDNGWRNANAAFQEAIAFIDDELALSSRLVLLGSIPESQIIMKRGSAGNSGGSDAIFIKEDSPAYGDHRGAAWVSALRNARLSVVNVGDGDSRMVDVDSVSDDELSQILDEAVRVRPGSQPRADRTFSDFKQILLATKDAIVSQNSVLLPRGIRSVGKVFMTTQPTILSTNFVSIAPSSEWFPKVLVSWMSTIFYQLQCEVEAKPQEGMRKMEVSDLRHTSIPKSDLLSEQYKQEIVDDFDRGIQFIDLSNPSSRSTDELWARIIFGEGDEWRSKLEITTRLLRNIVSIRNP